MIKVIGLGVHDGDLSIRGAVAIDSADTIIAKTDKTPTFGFFSEYQNVLTCDKIYESAEDFDKLDINIANFILQYKDKNTVYCVNGSGYDDNSVILLKQLYPQLEIIAGVNNDTVALNILPCTKYVSATAYDIAGNSTFDYDTDFSLIIKDVDDMFIAGEVKTVLSRLLGDETEVYIYIGGKVKKILLYELDRESDFDYATVILAPPQKLIDKNAYNYMDLLKIMYNLRGDNGCPWDKEQTHKSIRSNVIEEAYELADAIDSEDITDIIEESGDIILQGVFHTIICVDEGEAEQQEVLTTLCKKLISRHTHIFGDVKASNADEALKAWENAKAKEKNTETSSSKMLRIASALPSAMRAEKVQKIAQKSGLDFENSSQAYEKILKELTVYMSSADKESDGGKLMFALINLLGKDGIKSEVALNRALNKFINDYMQLEKLCEQSNKVMSELSAAQLIELWNKVQNNENR